MREIQLPFLVSVYSSPQPSAPLPAPKPQPRPLGANREHQSPLQLHNGSRPIKSKPQAGRPEIVVFPENLPECVFSSSQPSAGHADVVVRSCGVEQH